MIECAMCRRYYDSDQSAGACASCTLIAEGCGKVKCPYCGYENQRPLKDAALKWFDVLRRVRSAKAER